MMTKRVDFSWIKKKVFPWSVAFEFDGNISWRTGNWKHSSLSPRPCPTRPSLPTLHNLLVDLLLLRFFRQTAIFFVKRVGFSHDRLHQSFPQQLQQQQQLVVGRYVIFSRKEKISIKVCSWWFLSSVVGKWQSNVRLVYCRRPWRNRDRVRLESVNVRSIDFGCASRSMGATIELAGNDGKVDWLDQKDWIRHWWIQRQTEGESQ